MIFEERPGVFSIFVCRVEYLCFPTHGREEVWHCFMCSLPSHHILISPRTQALRLHQPACPHRFPSTSVFIPLALCVALTSVPVVALLCSAFLDSKTITYLLGISLTPITHPTFSTLMCVTQPFPFFFSIGSSASSNDYIH